jgi:hypothetical protein
MMAWGAGAFLRMVWMIEPFFSRTLLMNSGSTLAGKG